MEETRQCLKPLLTLQCHAIAVGEYYTHYANPRF